MIHVEHLHKSFGSVHAVDDVSFEVSRGEVVGLLGPNGAGETTTMRVITGYLSANEGLVSVDGVPVSEDGMETRQKIGYLPENSPLYLDMEVYEFLSYIARLRNVSAKKINRRIIEMIEICGLKSVIGRQAGKLSKGYRQRVGLAAAMIHKPPILILDEPTSGLDPNQIYEIRELIKNIGQERTVILSTHIMQEVEATCSRALIINSGKLVAHGTIDELLNRSGAHINYTVSIKATRRQIEERVTLLNNVNFGEWLTDELSEHQRLTLRCSDRTNHSEEIFNWAVKNAFILTELTHETTSLESVFRELTQN